MSSKAETSDASNVEASASDASKAEDIAPVQSIELSPSDRSTSPLTPVRHSRLVEKAELQNLNNRLASYIDKMKFLENENERLNTSAKISKQMLVDERAAASKSMDAMTLEKVKVEIDAKRIWEQNIQMNVKYHQKNKEAETADNLVIVYKSKYNESNSKYNAIVVQHKKTLVDADNMKFELSKLRKQFEECRTNLLNETLARVELENTVRGLREELKLMEQDHNEELNQSATSRQMDVTDIDGNLQESLQEIRDQYEDQMRSNRGEIESLFDARIRNGQYVQRDPNASNAEKHLCSRIDELNLKVAALEQNKLSLNNRVRDLQLLLDAERVRHAECDTEINRLRSEMTLQLGKYQDLMEIKVSLDLEIAAYDKLLCCEEHRLKISPNSFARGTPAAKRNRNDTLELVYDYEVTSSSAGNIEIIDVDPAVKSIKMHNKSENEIALGGWQLIRKVGAIQTVHMFHHLAKLEGGGDLFIWSSDSGVSPSPGNIVIESQWLMADNMKITLIDRDGNEEAMAERIRQQHLAGCGHVHQKNGRTGQKCSIM